MQKGTKKRVLLIEPDKLLAQTYKKALEQAGFTVDWQPSAQGAVTAIDKNRPRVIILELQLTAHNGVEFLHELRSHGDLQEIPVVLHTLVPITELHLNTTTKQQLGITKYLYKPQTTLKSLIEIAEEITN